MKFAYADPPYVGCAKLYKAEANYGGEVDHKELIQRLVREYPDGWALSCSSPSLQYLLSICPADVRVMAWVKPFHVFKKGVRPAYAWEPVIVRGGRNQNHPPPPKGGQATTPKDFVIANITLRKGLTGVKPEAFCFWLFEVLNLQPGDELYDLYPGSGAVTKALEKWWTVGVQEQLA